MPCREALMLPNCNCRSGFLRVRADFRIGLIPDLIACPKCIGNVSIRGGYMQVSEDWYFLTTCDQQCLTDVTIYYNSKFISSVTVLDYIVDCLTAPTINIVPFTDPITITHCSTASIDSTCFLAAFNRLEAVEIFGACPDGSPPILNVYLIFNYIQGADYNGVFSNIGYYFLQRIVSYGPSIEVCPPNLMLAIRKCTTCYRQVKELDTFNVKEDYEILKGITLGTQAYEQDFDISILRKMKLIGA
jgi:hypothetical protein